MLNPVQKEIAHAGVLGMKWGRRKAKTPKPAKSAKVKKQPSEDHTRMKELKKKGVKNLSNSELKELTTRMNLEKQYKDLDKASVNSGKKIAGDILKETGKELAKEALKGAVKTGIKTVTSK